MARKHNPAADPHYYSERLRQKLDLLASSHAAIVIDNFQFFCTALQPAFLAALLDIDHRAKLAEKLK